MAVGQNVLKSDHNQVHWGCCSRIPKQTKFFPEGEAQSTQLLAGIPDFLQSVTIMMVTRAGETLVLFI